MNAQLNKRERRAQQLLAHYETCERLARYLGVQKPDGKKISVALLKIERIAHAGATAYCNGECYQTSVGGYDFRRNENAWDAFKDEIETRVAHTFGRSHKYPPSGFFVNGDARGYALKIDNENAEGKALIDAVKLHTDWGGYGILSPEITGD